MEDTLNENMFWYKSPIHVLIFSQNFGYYPTKDKKVIRKLDRNFILEKIKNLSIAHSQGRHKCEFIQPN